MYKRVLPQVVLVLATIILTTLFQPLSHLQTPAQAQSGCQTFKETGHTLCGKFLTYWQQHGGLAQQGYPISEPFNEKSDLNGQTYQVQYFERAVFELHPENQPPNDVLLSQLGTFQARQKYGNPPVFPGAPAATPAPSAPPTVGATVQLQDSVILTFVQQYNNNPGEITSFQSCKGSMLWVFSIVNKSKVPYTVHLDNSSVSVTETDSTGKSYQLGGSSCLQIGKAFASSPTLAPGDEDFGDLTFNAADIPAAATYFDLRMTVGGQKLTFRYPLK